MSSVCHYFRPDSRIEGGSSDVLLLFVQFHYAVFFAYMRLREQEIRNLMWISECVAQNQKNRVHDSVVTIF